jgi:hypothetical protein
MQLFKSRNSRIVWNALEEKGGEITNSNNKNNPQDLLQKGQRLLKLIGILIVAKERQEYERDIKNSY